MIDFDTETTGLQPWGGEQYAFMYIFFDGDAAERVRDYEEAAKAILAATEDGTTADDQHYAVVDGFDEDDYNWHKPWTLRVPRPSERTEEQNTQIQAWFDRASASPEGIRAWNSNFDRSWAEIEGFKVPPDGKWHDGMIVAQAIDERRSVALKAVAVQLFGPDADEHQKSVKDWLKAERARRKKAAKEAGSELVEPNYSDVPSELMEPYAAEDVILTRKISDHYAPILTASPDLHKLVEFERGVMDALFAVQRRGLPASSEDYRHLEVEVAKNLEVLEEKVNELGSCVEDFNPRSSAKIIEALKARGANMDSMETEGGKIKSADADNLRAVDDELALEILKFRSEFKVLSTYVRPMLGRSYVTAMRMWKTPFLAPDGRIHTNYRQSGARTGRMSSSDPNVQNISRDDLRLRYCIRAEEGHKIVAVDLKNIEMMLFAAYSGEGRLLSAIQAGEDVHELTARMLGFRDRKRADGSYESARQLGKVFGFTIIYGGGMRSIRKYFRCSMDDARLYKRRYMDAFPEVKELGNIIEYRLADQGYISDNYISGRRFRVDPRDAYKATNYLIQGTAAALFKKALVAMHAEGIPVVGLVHDEILAHVEAGAAEDTSRRISHHLTDHPEIAAIVPLGTDATICDHWSEAKDPDFKPNWRTRSD